MNRDRALFRHFELNPQSLYWGTVHESYAQRIRDAIESRRMIGVIGGFGSGKSTLVAEALKDVANLEIIYVDNSDRERLRIGNITHVMAAHLLHLTGSTEGLRRDNTSRQTQLGRLLGEAVFLKRKEVVVVVENAHRLAHQTLLALKDLRESARFKSEAFLFSVILVGQEGLRSLLERYGEVHYRTRPIELDRNGWMSYSERVAYLLAIYGTVIAPETRNRLASLFPTPLQLDHFIEERLLSMRDGGVAVMDATVVPLSVKEQRAALKMSLRDLERISGVPKSTISDYDNGRITDDATLRDVEAKLQKGLDQHAASMNGGESHLRRVGT